MRFSEIDRDVMQSQLAEAFARREAMSPEERVQHDAELVAKHEREYAEKARRHQIAAAQKLSNVGERFRERTFETYTPLVGCEDALDTALAIAENPATGGWFTGGKGLGKTHLAAAIVNAVTARGIPATFISVMDFADVLTDYYDQSGKVREGRTDVIRRLAGVRVLVLDDIDKPVESKFFAARILQLANKRYEHKLPVIVTSNEPPSVISAKWAAVGGDRGGAGVDRLLEMARYYVKLEGDSYRMRLPKYLPTVICSIDSCGHLFKAHDPENATCLSCPSNPHDFKPVMINGAFVTPRTESELYKQAMEQKHSGNS